MRLQTALHTYAHMLCHKQSCFLSHLHFLSLSLSQVRPSSQQPQSSDSQASLSSATDASHLGWSGVPGRAGAQSDNRGLALAELEDGSVCLMCCPGACERCYALSG